LAGWRSTGGLGSTESASTTFDEDAAVGEPKKRLMGVAWWVILLVAAVVLLMTLTPHKPDRFERFAVFERDVEADRVANIRVDDNTVVVERRNGEKYYTLGVVDDALISQLSEQGVPVAHGPADQGWLTILLIYMVAGVVIIIVLVKWLRRAGGMNNILSLRKTRARLIPESSKVTFADVGGCAEAKELLGDVVDFLKNPQRWAQASVRPPRGVLLEGPPGCGKTLLARAVAGETNARFYLSAASEFVEMFVGVGATRVRDTFDTARRTAPSVVFIDELDAIGRRRGSGVGWSNDEREHTLNQLLLCLDGVEGREPVVVIAATNRPDILDTALVRPGRFDRRIRIPPLVRAARIETLRIHARRKPLAADVSLEALADRTDGFSGAQLESLVNEAALMAMRRVRGANGQRIEVRMEDFEAALHPTATASRIFNKLDALLIESTTQLAEPTGKAIVRVFLDGEAIEGELIWADAHFVKIGGDRGQMIVPKAQIERIEALEGTESADPSDVKPDLWARRHSGLT
jgi:cell division protease FtsH